MAIVARDLPPFDLDDTPNTGATPAGPSPAVDDDDDEPDFVIGASPSTQARRGPFTPSPQQAVFLDALRNQDRHILLEARAGSGKSRTCSEGARVLPRNLRATYCCFNSHIAKEFQRDLPSTCQAATMHSISLRILKQHFGQSFTVDSDGEKVLRIAETFFPGKWERSERHAVNKLVGLCKNLLWHETDPARLKSLAIEYGVDLRNRDDEILAVVPEVLRRCLDQTEIIDFDDMIWMPVALGLEASSSTSSDVLFIDEAQDLNPCQHALVNVFCPDGRIIVTGDRFQSLYAFRGADSDSIPLLESNLSTTTRGMESYPLTVTRRCPRSHVEMARRIVPDLDYLSTAPDGLIDQTDPEKWSEEIGPGTMVLCRTNAPLIAACFRLLSNNIKATVRGRDIGKGLLTFLFRLRASNVPDLVRKIRDFQAREIGRLSEVLNPANALAALQDRCDCLAAMTIGTNSIDDVRKRIETLFSDVETPDTITLSSVHRAKGLEADHVVILRPDLMPFPGAKSAEDQQQERNLLYVGATRAKQRMTFAGPVPSLLSDNPEL